MRTETNNSAPDRVLLLEDNAIVALDMIEQLRALGFTDVAYSPVVTDALAAFDKQAFKLAVIDIGMTEGTSQPVVDRANDLALPVILTSGYDDAHLLETEPDHFVFLQKPVCGTSLQNAISQLLGPAGTGAA
ncbi:response regulator [Aliishimia ponticola]|uniref:Response regulator n=1 Tax=Aliishimia ponticola TaxID=2499833 RepID=A0A4S4NF27_9RHOB|nr:response regulator [Aliishimia ponticola]THH38109.1 response regulator [Aliishimia ponticola]